MRVGDGRQVMTRELCQILTPGTLLDDALLATPAANNLLTIVEWSSMAANGTTLATLEFGVCYGDCSLGTFSIAFVGDDSRRMQLQTLLLRTAPREIVYHRNALSKATLHLIQRCVRNATLTSYDDSAAIGETTTTMSMTTTASTSKATSGSTSTQIMRQLQYVKTNFFKSTNELPSGKG